MNRKLSEFTFRGKRIPERMWGGIERYIEQGMVPGDFLSAVICNDLQEAVGRSDDENINLLAVYIAYFYNVAPSQCWGSPEKMKAWIQRHKDAAVTRR